MILNGQNFLNRRKYFTLQQFYVIQNIWQHPATTHHTSNVDTYCASYNYNWCICPKCISNSNLVKSRMPTFYCSIAKSFKVCTGHGCTTVVLCANFVNDLSTKLDKLDERDFVWFEIRMCFRWISTASWPNQPFDILGRWPSTLLSLVRHPYPGIALTLNGAGRYHRLCNDV